MARSLIPPGSSKVEKLSYPLFCLEYIFRYSVFLFRSVFPHWDWV